MTPNIKICSKHRVKAEWKTGTSKKSGKAYAFWACPEKDNGEFCNAEVVDAPDEEGWLGETPAISEREVEKSRRIERQHSQEMAIRFLELRFEIDPASFKKAIEKTDLKSMIKAYTDFFVNDLEKPINLTEEITREVIDDEELERINKAIDG